MEESETRGAALLARVEAPRLRSPYLFQTAMENSSWRELDAQRTPSGVLARFFSVLV